MPPQPPYAVVFDLDGTLVETAPDLVGAANVVARAQGWPGLDPVADRCVAGQGGRALLRRAMECAFLTVDEAEVERLLPDFLAVYEARIADDSHLYDGVIACLDALDSEGFRVGICTNKPEGLARLLLDKLGIGHRFGALLGADTLPVRKPDPAPLIETLARLGAEAGRAVMVGDTMTDSLTARAAGMPFVFTRHGYALDSEGALAPVASIDGLQALPAVVADIFARAQRARRFRTAD